jgi:hypothetical protein
LGNELGRLKAEEQVSYESKRVAFTDLENLRDQLKRLTFDFMYYEARAARINSVGVDEKAEFYGERAILCGLEF